MRRAPVGASRTSSARGVDLLIDRGADEGADWREATRAAAGLWRDRADVDAMAKTLRKTAKRGFKSSYGGK